MGSQQFVFVAGLASGCAVLRTVNPLDVEAAPAPIQFELDGGACFTDQENGIELWPTEGSAATTTLVADVFAANRSSSREMWWSLAMRCTP
ncbi:MAG: ELWxxDGT repeat protein [Ilumatobacter sp.]|jgi:ELWxxDGT repeat protein